MLPKACLSLIFRKLPSVQIVRDLDFYRPMMYNNHLQEILDKYKKYLNIPPVKGTKVYWRSHLEEYLNVLSYKLPNLLNVANINTCRNMIYLVFENGYSVTIKKNLQRFKVYDEHSRIVSGVYRKNLCNYFSDGITYNYTKKFKILKPWKDKKSLCIHCNKYIRNDNMSRHRKTLKHRNNMH